MNERYDDVGNVVRKGAAVGHGPAPTSPPPPAWGSHRHSDCEQCQLYLLMYGESVYDIAKNEHISPVDLLRIQAEPNAELVEAFKRRFKLI